MIKIDKELPIIISVGGSLIFPKDRPDPKFLSAFNLFVRKYIEQKMRFFLIAGGGKLCRLFQEAGHEVINNMTKEDLDWLGVHSTRLNAHLLRTIFVDIAHSRIIENYDHKLENWVEPVVIGAGWKPGWSTDYDAVILARDYGAKLIINLSNINHVFDKDPSKFNDAKPIKSINWEKMEALVGDKWTPGLNMPFDPIATKLAKELGLTVIIANGNDFENLDKILNNREFQGTVITPE